MTSTLSSSRWRPRGDKATMIQWEAPNNDNDDDDDDCEYILPPRTIWDSLKHGDLVHDPNGFRASGTFVVVAATATAIGVGDSKELQRTTNSGGYCEIQSHITRYIEDPIDFYSNHLILSSLSDPQSSLCRVEDMTIHFDTMVHQAMLARQAGNRPIYSSRKIWYQACSGEYQMEIPASPEFPNGGEIAPLDSSTPVEYLGNANYLPQGDPLTLRRRTAIRKANDPSVENGGTATRTFRTMETGQCLELRSFPQPNNDNHGDSDAGAITGMSATLIRVEPPQPPSSESSAEEGQQPQSTRVMVPVERVVLDLGTGGGDEDKLPTIFELRLCEMTTGDYANSYLWVADNPTRYDDDDHGSVDSLPLAWMIILWPKP